MPTECPQSITAPCLPRMSKLFQGEPARFLDRKKPDETLDHRIDSRFVAAAHALSQYRYRPQPFFDGPNLSLAQFTLAENFCQSITLLIYR